MGIYRAEREQGLRETGGPLRSSAWAASDPLAVVCSSDTDCRTSASQSLLQNETAFLFHTLLKEGKQMCVCVRLLFKFTNSGESDSADQEDWPRLH